MTLHLTRWRDFSSENCTERVVASLTMRCVVEIIPCHVKWRNIRMAGEKACRCHHLGLEEDRNGVEMPSGTGNSWYFQIFGKFGQPWQVDQNFPNDFLENFFPFDVAPEFLEILVEWNVPLDWLFLFFRKSGTSKNIEGNSRVCSSSWLIHLGRWKKVCWQGNILNTDSSLRSYLNTKL